MLKIKKLRDNAKLPVKAKNGDAGWDVFSCEKKTLYQRERYKFGLGIAVEFPENWHLRTEEKSGLALRGIIVLGPIIDSGYRGEINVILMNLSEIPFNIEEGQKIAQIVLVPCNTDKNIIEVSELSESERGENGFGSTGQY